jgi:hypothetical protein
MYKKLTTNEKYLISDIIEKYNYNVEYHQVWVDTAYDQNEYLSTIIAIRYSEFPLCLKSTHKKIVSYGDPLVIPCV